MAGRIDLVLRGSDGDVDAFLMSGELWGVTGSVVAGAGATDSPEARRDLQEAFIGLGEWQVAHGYVHPGVTSWIEILRRRRELPLEPNTDRVLRGGRGGRTLVPWSPRDVWLGVLAAAVIVGAAFAFVYVLSAYLPERNLDLWVILVPTLFELLFLLPAWWFAVRKHGASLKTLGFAGFKPRVLAIGIGMLIAVYYFNGVYALLLEQFGLRMQSDITPLMERLSSPWPLVVSTVIVAPVVEETFFRGFVFAGLRARYGWPWAAAISSALFAAVHLEITFFIPAFLLGYLFAYLYQRSDSIWPGTIVHTLVNVLALTVAYSLS